MMPNHNVETATFTPHLGHHIGPAPTNAELGISMVAERRFAPAQEAPVTFFERIMARLRTLLNK